MSDMDVTAPRIVVGKPTLGVVKNETPNVASGISIAEKSLSDRALREKALTMDFSQAEQKMMANYVALEKDLSTKLSVLQKNLLWLSQEAKKPMPTGNQKNWVLFDIKENVPIMIESTDPREMKYRHCILPLATRLYEKKAKTLSRRHKHSFIALPWHDAIVRLKAMLQTEITKISPLLEEVRDAIQGSREVPAITDKEEPAV